VPDIAGRLSPRTADLLASIPSTWKTAGFKMMAPVLVNTFAGEIKSGGRFKAAQDAARAATSITDNCNVDSVIDSSRQFIFYN